ncbi:50S ribosomal protein L11 methyltransferase [Spirulina major]|uniref:50S ribosomal protein L11 methyltransferase n=1 Tax=Spirulina major TaxID=270636 RepID=UPI000933D291|nr:class I SAM-dependent methyltransferase [Spirulina major]
MYSIFGYGEMMMDAGRMGPYHQALSAVVQPGMVVLDVGTGTGIHSLMAAQLGARRVYGVEPDGVVDIAREITAANGYGAVIEYYQADVRSLHFPEPIDVVVSDLRGVLPLFGSHLATIIEVRDRHLAPNGVLIPQADRLWATLVHLPDIYHQYYHAPWQSQPYGFDFSAAQRYVINRWRKVRLRPEDCLVPSQPWATLDYPQLQSPDVQGDLQWDITTDCRCHGVGLWFDTTLWAGVGFSNGPDQPPLIYSQAFFPWPEPLDLQRGDRITLQLRANLVNQRYLWQWHSTIARGDRRTTFRQTTFNADPINPTSLAKRRHTHRPNLSGAGQMAQVALAAMAAGDSLGDIAQRLEEQFPDQFSRPAQALTWVTELSDRYGV